MTVAVKPFTATPAVIIANVLLQELGLEPNRVMLSNQKIFIPTPGLYIVVSYVGPAKIISNQNTWEDDGDDGLIETQSLTMLHVIQIDLMAYNNPDGSNDARDRKEEIAMALRSIYSQQLQDANSMQIARQPGPMLDTSFLEATEMMTRYTTAIMTTSLYEKQKPVDSYATFTAELWQDDFHPTVPVLVPPLNTENP